MCCHRIGIAPLPLLHPLDHPLDHQLLHPLDHPLDHLLLHLLDHPLDYLLFYGLLMQCTDSMQMTWNSKISCLDRATLHPRVPLPIGRSLSSSKGHRRNRRWLFVRLPAQAILSPAECLPQASMNQVLSDILAALEDLGRWLR